MPAKLKAPDNCGGISHEGVEYTPDENGIIEVPDGVDLGPLLDHGLTIFTGEAKKAEAGQDDAEREALFNRAVDMGLKPHWNLGAAKLKEMIAEEEARLAEEAKKAEAGGSGESDPTPAPAGGE